jgi:serine/threonine protein kinase
VTSEAKAPRPKKSRFDPKPGVVVVDKYRVESILGEGGMGVVVAATHLGLDQRVAIKFLHPEAMRQQEAVERFQREAKVAAKVNSEHVARVHDVGTLEGGEPFIVMEYLEGSDLRDLIRRGEPLPIAEACEMALQACEALAEVHAAGIVHRDLKPSNLFITRRADGSPCVKLLDFGISKFNFRGDSGFDPALTATATVMGSPSYMSPEQLKSSKEVDASSDVWSLGTVLYEAVTGRPAFRAETVPQVCAMIASDDPALPSSLRTDIPMQLERAILECLEKKPERRTRLVDLARAIVDLAPERARVSLERMEAVLGEVELRPRPPRASQILDAMRDELPILPLATAAQERSLSTSEMGALSRKRRGGGMFAFFTLVALGVLAAGLYTGGISVRALRGEIAGAASAVASAVGSGLPSGLPSGLSSNRPAVPTSPAPIPTTTPVASESAAASASAQPAPAPLASTLTELLFPSVDASTSLFGSGDQTDQPSQPEEPLLPLPAAPASTTPPVPTHPAATAHAIAPPPPPPAPPPAKHHTTKKKHSVKIHRHY